MKSKDLPAFDAAEIARLWAQRSARSPDARRAAVAALAHHAGRLGGGIVKRMREQGKLTSILGDTDHGCVPEEARRTVNRELRAELDAVIQLTAAECVSPKGRTAWDGTGDFAAYVTRKMATAINTHLRTGGSHERDSAVGGIDTDARRAPMLRASYDTPAKFADDDGRTAEQIVAATLGGADVEPLAGWDAAEAVREFAADAGARLRGEVHDGSEQLTRFDADAPRTVAEGASNQSAGAGILRAENPSGLPYSRAVEASAWLRLAAEHPKEYVILQAVERAGEKRYIQQRPKQRPEAVSNTVRMARECLIRVMAEVRRDARAGRVLEWDRTELGGFNQWETRDREQMPSVNHAAADWVYRSVPKVEPARAPPRKPSATARAGNGRVTVRPISAVVDDLLRIHCPEILARPRTAYASSTLPPQWAAALDKVRGILATNIAAHRRELGDRAEF